MGSRVSQALLASLAHQAHQGPWGYQASTGCLAPRGTWGQAGLQEYQGCAGTRARTALQGSQGCQEKGACPGHWDLLAQQAPKVNQGSSAFLGYLD